MVRGAFMEDWSVADRLRASAYAAARVRSRSGPGTASGLTRGAGLQPECHPVSLCDRHDLRRFPEFGGQLWARRSLEPACRMVVISAPKYVFQHHSEPEYSLWSVLPLAASGFLPLVIGTPDRILRFLPWLFGGIWLFTARSLDSDPLPE